MLLLPAVCAWASRLGTAFLLTYSVSWISSSCIVLLSYAGIKIRHKLIADRRWMLDLWGDGCTPPGSEKAVLPLSPGLLLVRPTNVAGCSRTRRRFPGQQDLAVCPGKVGVHLIIREMYLTALFWLISCLFVTVLQMTKKIKKLEKETTMYRSRWESSNKALLEMAEEVRRLWLFCAEAGN